MNYYAIGFISIIVSVIVVLLLYHIGIEIEHGDILTVMIYFSILHYYKDKKEEK